MRVKTFFFAALGPLLVSLCLGQSPPSLSPADEKLLREVAALRPFLEDSPDVRSEPQSIGKFFNAEVYARLKGNAVMGYLYDEGFLPSGNTIQVETFRSLPDTDLHLPAFRRTFATVLSKTSLRLVDKSPNRIGICLVGVEPLRSSQTLAGVCVEVYITNADTRKTLFHRIYAGGERGLADAMLQASILICAHVLRKTP